MLLLLFPDATEKVLPPSLQQTLTASTMSAAEAIESIRSRIATRAGPQQYMMLRRFLVGASSATEARQALAELYVRIPDEQFDALAQALAPFDGAAFWEQISGPVSRRRTTVVRNAFESLNHGSIDNAITFSTICDRCDFSRNVTKERVEEERSRFLDLWNVGDAITYGDFDAFYRGMTSSTGEDDRAFEILVMRTWNLDKAASSLSAAQAAAAATCAKSLSGGSGTMSKMGRDHPLYKTAGMEYGSTVHQAPPPVQKFNRTGKFTSQEPPPSGSSGFNCSSTKGRFI